MSIYAIGPVREQNGDTGVRLLSTDSGKCMDVPMNQLSYYINKDEGIRNLGFDKQGKLNWKQGSIDRYPVIDKLKGIITNKESIIVIGVLDFETHKVYRVCNMSGQVTTIGANELIDYGKQYKIANCKVVKKGKTEYISAIEGTLEEIDTKPRFKMDYDLGTLIAYIPFIESDTLVIPDMVDGKPLIKISNIQIQPAIIANKIKKLVLSKYIKDITLGLFTSMPALEHVDILASDTTIYDCAFSTLPNVRTIHIKSVKALGMGACEGLRNLESFTVDKPLEYIHSHMFEKCSKLDISTVLVDGVEAIYTKAFYGNERTKHLIIPKSCRQITTNAFERTAITDVDVQTEILKIESNSRKVTNKLFSGSNTVRMEVNRNAIIDTALLGSNVVLIRRDASDKDKQIEKKIQKSTLVGLELNNTEVISSPKAIANTLMSISQEGITNAMLELVQQALIQERAYPLPKIFDIDGFKIELSILPPFDMKATKSIMNIGKYIVVTGKTISFYPVDRKLIKKFALNYASQRRLRIIPMKADSKYLKSVNVGEDGVVRLIYVRDGERSVLLLNKYKIEL